MLNSSSHAEQFTQVFSIEKTLQTENGFGSYSHSRQRCMLCLFPNTRQTKAHKFYQSSMNQTITLSASGIDALFLDYDGVSTKPQEKSVFVSFLFVEIWLRNASITKHAQRITSEGLQQRLRCVFTHLFPQSGLNQQMADKTVIYGVWPTKTGRALVTCSSANDQERSQSSNISGTACICRIFVQRKTVS